VEGHELSPLELDESLEEIIRGVASPAQVAGFLVALRGKGETADELAGFAAALRRHSKRMHPVVSGRLVDTCGTGGDGAGVFVAKHGNRSVTGKSGSADLLESLGFNLAVEPSKVEESIEQVGIGFMFAPTFHPAMKQVGPVRKELGIRTVFNLMGPLMNPAGADYQLLGVYSSSLTSKVAHALRKLGTKEAMVVHGLEGMDEISVTGRTQVSWLKGGEVTTREHAPADFALEAAATTPPRVSSPEESAGVVLDILRGGKRKDGSIELVLVNAAAAIVLGGLAQSFAEAIPIASTSIESGAAFKKLEGMIKHSGGSLEKLENHATTQ